MFLQAPVVALFLLLGFVNQPFQEEMPSTRPLTEQEKKPLRQARDALADLRQGKTLTPEQQRALLQVRMPGGATLEKTLAGKIGPEQEKMLDYLANTSQPVLPDRIIVHPGYTYLMLIVVALVVLWFGCNTSSKEIIK